MTKPKPDQNDPADMLGHVLAWPDLLSQGFNQPLELPDQLKRKRQIVCCGMGGSAIGAGIIGEYLSAQLDVPYLVVRDYTLPAFVGQDTLVVCLSYSGNTEETLAGYNQAKNAKAALLAITTGGTLADNATADGVPLLTFEYEAQPRATLPLTLGLLLAVFSKLGYVADQQAALAEAHLTVAELAEQAKAGQDKVAGTLAESLQGKVPVVYGAGVVSEAARRLKGQVSENAKQAAAFEVLPEQNHNALVGYEYPPDLAKHLIYVLLRTDFEHPRHAARFAATKQVIRKRGLTFIELSGHGDDVLSQLCSILFWGDLASVKLAYLNRTDPTPVKVIEELKKTLGK